MKYFETAKVGKYFRPTSNFGLFFFKNTTLIMKKFDTFRVEKEELTPIRI